MRRGRASRQGAGAHSGAGAFTGGWRAGCDGPAIRDVAQRAADLGRALQREGIEGLVDRHGGGAPARLTAEQRHALKERVLAGADLERDAIVAYRILDIRARAEREFGARYSHGGMHRVLRAIGCAWLMPRPHHPKGDAEAQDEFKKNSRKWSRTSPASIPASR